MADYLSDEWFDELGATPVEAAGTGGGAALVLQHVVTDTPAGDVDYYVRIADRDVTIVRGRAPQADVTFRQDYVTAAAVASGQLSAPAALLAGRIRVGGDMAGLLARQELLAVAVPVPLAVRAATTYR